MSAGFWGSLGEIVTRGCHGDECYRAKKILRTTVALNTNVRAGLVLLGFAYCMRHKLFKKQDLILFLCQSYTRADMRKFQRGVVPIAVIIWIAIAALISGAVVGFFVGNKFGLLILAIAFISGIIVAPRVMLATKKWMKKSEHP